MHNADFGERGAYTQNGLKQEMPRRAAPLLEHQAKAAIMRRLLSGKEILGAFIAVGFSLFFRPHELLMLDREDLVVDQTSVDVVRLVATKIGQRFGVEEGLPIEDKVVLQILRLVLQRFTDPNEKLAGMTYGQFHLERQALSEHFGWDIMRYTLYCMRRGGAARHYRLHRDMTRTCLLGRQAAMSTARIYFTEAMASIAKLENPSQKEVCEDLAMDLDRLVI